MKKGKLGPATPAPDDEMVLAVCIANAKAAGLKACRGAAYLTKDGRRTYRESEEKARCCVLGAWWLTAPVMPHPIDGMVGGNDWPDDIERGGPGHTVGAAFQEAMADE